jgi:hypothetical protein
MRFSAALAVFVIIVPEAVPAAMTDWSIATGEAQLRTEPDSPTVTAQLVYGGAGDDYAFDLCATDSGYVLTGRTRDPGTGDFDAFVLAVDRAGLVVWAKRWGGADLDMGFSVRTLGDGTIVVAGWTKSFGAGDGDFFLLGLSSSGEMKFERTFGGARDDRATQLWPTRDGGIVIVGESYSFGNGDCRFLVVKTDADGNLLWQHTYDGGEPNERGLAIVEHAGGFLFAGNSMDTTSGSTTTRSEGFVVLTDRNGNPHWSRRLGRGGVDILHHAAPLGGGHVLLTGYARSDAQAAADVWLVVIDSEGRTLKNAVIPRAGDEHSIVARPLPAGGVMLCGYARADAEADWDAQVIHLGGYAEPTWSATYRGDADDGAASIVCHVDGTLAVAGYTASFGAGGQDVLLMRLDGRTR